MPLEAAAPPLLQRSVMDDEAHLKRFTKTFIDAATAVKGARFVAHNDDKLNVAAKALYYGSFAAAAVATVGEELVGLLPVQFDSRVRNAYEHFATMGGTKRYVRSPNNGELLRVTVPASVGSSPLSLLRRMLLGLFMVAEGAILRRFAAKFFPQKDPQAVISRVQSVHTMLFYLFGTYAILPHRLAGVRYLATSPSVQDEWKGGHNPYFHLGLMMLLEHLYLLFIAIREKVRELNQSRHGYIIRPEGDTMGITRIEPPTAASKKNKKGFRKSGEANDGSASESSNNDAVESEDDDIVVGKPSVGQCMLCLSKRKVPTATTCGHIFCWECLMDWLKTAKVCPLCRVQCHPCQLVPLRGYKMIQK